MKTIQKILFVFLITISVISCRKDEETSTIDNEIATANFEADYFSESDVSDALAGSQTQNGYSARTNSETTTQFPCRTIQLLTAPNVFPMIFRINYGTGCTNSVGITKSGALKVTLSNFVANTNSIMTIERENYYVNLRKVEGTITYLNQTTNPTTPTWRRTVTNGKITRPNGNIFLHSGFRIVKLMEGASTPILTDNLYHILEGNHTIQRPNGTQLTATITETLIKPFTCNNVTKGKMSLNGTFLNGIIDYGNGTCDNQATFTNSNGNTINITL